MYFDTRWSYADASPRLTASIARCSKVSSPGCCSVSNPAVTTQLRRSRSRGPLTATSSIVLPRHRAVMLLDEVAELPALFGREDVERLRRRLQGVDFHLMLGRFLLVEQRLRRRAIVRVVDQRVGDVAHRAMQRVAIGLVLRAQVVEDGLNVRDLLIREVESVLGALEVPEEHHAAEIAAGAAVSRAAHPLGKREGRRDEDDRPDDPRDGEVLPIHGCSPFVASRYDERPSIVEPV